jgi:hypothetical protein
MRPSNKSRSRNKPGGGNGGHNNPRQRMGNIINRVFDSAGPDGKVRGTPQQIIDKYNVLARDAQVSGDRVAAENYLQHAEHYSRLLGEAQRQQAEQRFGQDRDDGQRGGEDASEQPQPRHEQPQRQPDRVASGLTTIEPEDAEDGDGLIDTPENRNQPVPAAPAQQAEPQPENAQAADGAPAEAAAPARRPRTRRRPKQDAPAAEAAQAE